MDLKTGLAEAVKQLRQRRHISQEQLALQAEIDRRYLSDIENGRRNVSIEILQRLATTLGISTPMLLTIAESGCYPFATVDELKNYLCQLGHHEAVVFDSPDYLEAVSGITDDGRVVYSYSLMVSSLVDNDGMTAEEAIEFIDYNTVRALPYMGDKAPVILYEIER